MNREELELLTEIRDFVTLFFEILIHESSGRFVKTELIKCEARIVIVTSPKASAPTK